MFARAFYGRAGTLVLRARRLEAMPLKARIVNPAFISKVPMSTDTVSQSVDQATLTDKSVNTADVSTQEVSQKQTRSDPPNDVVFRANYGVRVMELNRPKKLHSLSGSMIRKLTQRLQEYAKSDMANVIVLQASGSKAFCAGGDVAAIAELDLTTSKGHQQAMEYFGEEYRLDHLIATYKKPIIAHMDGITMGGGAGLSMHAPFRIATENTVWAMPETTIGFFPDVGASFFLPRLPGAMGTYFALTSEKVKGVNAFYTGIATHYMHSATLSMLENRLAELRFIDSDRLEKRLDLVNATVDEYATGLPHDEPMMYKGELRKAIDRCFRPNNIFAIISALKAETGETKEWAEQTLQTLYTKSPTSLLVALQQLRLGRNWTISETFFREHQIAAKFLKHPDFKEGVSALLLRKDRKPQWQPKALEDVMHSSDFLDIDPDLNVNLLGRKDYLDYPHVKYGVPKETDIEALVKQQPRTRVKIVNEFLRMMGDQQGVADVVNEVLDRKTRLEKEIGKERGHGKAVWID